MGQEIDQKTIRKTEICVFTIGNFIGVVIVVLAHIWGIKLGRKWERQKIAEYIHHRGQYDLFSFKIIDIGMEVEQSCHHKGAPVPDLLKERCLQRLARDDRDENAL